MNKPRKQKRVAQSRCALIGGSPAVRDAIEALELAEATLTAVVGYRDILPRDLTIHAATVRNLCNKSAHELRQPQANT